ncbi:MAG: hypothetical protein KBS91_02100, partial [Firmicutes bacterium]|nr:hypothetical protein [Candidatus Caballimonas caccae]
MKKTLLKTIVTIFLLVTLCLGAFACDKTSFAVKDGFKVTEKITANSQGGFVLEAGDFYYVINGMGNSTADNSFGKPIKGSLIAVKKDFSDSAIIVPKLFVASDYSAGIYIFDGYVYFATPSTSVELTGETKNSYLTFAKTKLDGTGYTEFATVSGLSTEYRFAKSGDNVFVIYYDSENSQLVSLNTVSKGKTVIAKTDDKENESLDSYKFFDDLENGIVAYTTKIYKGENIEGTIRATEIYNKVYVYSVGDNDEGHTGCYGKILLDGQDSTLKDENYTIKAISDGYVIYTLTNTFDTTGKTFIKYTPSNSIPVDKEFDATYILDMQNLTIYTLDTTNKKIIATVYDFDTTLGKFVKESNVFADGANVTTLLFKEGDYVYFVNSENRLARIKELAMLPEYISEGSINASWYKPTLMDDGIMYLDNSTQGASNVKFVKLDDRKADYQDNDDTKDIISYHYEGQKFVARDLRLEEDIVAGCDAEIDSISSTLDKNGRITEETKSKLQEIKDEYKGLSKESQELIKDCYAELDKYDDAIALARICKDLEDIETKLTDEAKNNETYKKAYNDAVSYFELNVEVNGNSYLESVCNLMEGNTYY